MEHETTLRLTVFFGLFAVLALAEVASPRRRRTWGRWQRWFTNWSISLSNAVLTGVMKAGLGAAAVLAAADASASGIGLFHAIDAPGWLEGLIVFVILDFAIWLQHVLSHRVPVLWRLHRVHHADPDMDVSTAIRFHPIEIGLSMLLKIALVYALGAPVLAVILFEVVLNGAAMFNHTNVRIPAAVEQRLRLAIVTPDMHRVHHSTDPAEQIANFGFNLSVWDRIFGTYRAAPRLGHDDMRLGLSAERGPEPTGLLWSLMFPFRR
ncbi:MAG: sterol desaturase family protein [Pseudomonadota bacterium]